MSFITKPLGNILGSVTGQTQADASLDAGRTQQQGATDANNFISNQYAQNAAGLQPYADLGQNSINPLISALGYNRPATGDRGLQVDSSSPLQQTFSYGDYAGPGTFTAPTAAEAAATPGYQFTLDQGLKANQNSASARGLGSSGAALKGASTYATGLADSTYGDTYNRALSAFNTNATNGLNTYTTNRNNALGNFTTNYNDASSNANRLLGLVQAGQTASAQTGVLGANAANTIGNNITSGAAAQAAGQVGAGNAYGKATNNLFNIGSTLFG